MKTRFFLIVISLVISSCVASRKVKMTDCNQPHGWCKEIRDISVKSWKYAQLSKDVYNKPFQFIVSDYFEKIEDYENSSIDFFATLYKEKSKGNYILVYRGTDSLKDFKTGNNSFKQEQNIYGLKIFDSIKKQYGSLKYTVVGHSLGGGIAIHISLNRENVTAYTFNGSPVFKNINNFVNDRYSIVERGEILKAMRLFGREATQLYTSIGCTRGNPLTQHDMQSLAICLTQIAAIDSPEARKSLEKNSIEFEY